MCYNLVKGYQPTIDNTLSERKMDMPRKKIKPDDKGDSKIIDIKTQKPVDKKTSIVCKTIRKYREELGIEQKELGAIIGVSGNAVCNWENGYTRPDINLLPRICEALHITLYELYDIEDPLLRYTAGEQMMIADYRQLTKSHQYVMDKTLSALKVAELVDECPDIKKLILFDKSLAAGIGDPTEFDDKGEPIYVYSNPMVKRADCVFYVNGDSMEPKFLSGDMVLVQRFPDCGSANPGDIGAFITHNETYIKEYRKDGLHSLNSAYPTMKFDEDDDVFFIGKGIGILDPYEDIASEEDLRKYQLVYGEDD